MGKITQTGWSKEFRRLNPRLCGPAPQTWGDSGALKPKSGLPAPKSPLAAKFEGLWKIVKGPALTPEFRFCKRRWRFDFALPAQKIAIELEGGILARVGHAHPASFVKDCNKYNRAAMDGWAVLRLATGMVTHGAVAEIAAFCRRKILEERL